MYIRLASHGIVALLKRNDKFLLLEDCRDPMKGSWAPPHGRFKTPDKTEEDIVIREVKEETNLNVKPLRKVWTTKADTKVKTVSFWLVDFSGREVKIDSKESSGFGWFTIDEALQKKLYPGTKEFFKKVKRSEIPLE